MGRKSKGRFSAYENSKVSIFFTDDGIRIRRKRSLGSLLGGLIAAGLVVGAGGLLLWQRFDWSLPGQEARGAEEFRLAVNQAMGAAELTQVAASRSEWDAVASWWQEAVDLMQAVPPGSPHYGVAQEKVAEYQRNFAYAVEQVRSQPTAAPSSGSLWQLGDTRQEVIRIQGEPSRTVRYDSLCREVLYYKNSKISLEQGIVTEYEDNDNQLWVAEGVAPPQLQPVPGYWTLGDSKETLLQIQGTPTQLTRYDSLNQTVLFYDRSFVELADGVVTGYSNVDGSLFVSLAVPSSAAPSDGYWRLDSDRNEILAIQGTPDRVTQSPMSCEETLYYGTSSIELRNGHVQGYQNLEGNLFVR